MTPHEPFAPQSQGPYVAPRSRLRSVAFVVGGIWLTIVALVCVIAAGRDVDDLACNLGFPWNCASVGLLYASQAQQWQDPSRAARAAVFLEKACEGGVDNACNSLGVLYARGRGVKKDEVRAAALYQRACSGGSLIACSNLGSAQLDGRGVEEEIELAITNFKRACDGGYAGGCNGQPREVALEVRLRALTWLPTAPQACCHDLRMLEGVAPQPDLPRTAITARMKHQVDVRAD